MNIVTERSASGKARTPIKLLEFHPHKLQSNQIEVRRNVAATVGVSHVEEYTTTSCVTFGGRSVRDSKVVWTWNVDDFLKDGLEDPWEFWLTIPPVKKGVMAAFKVTSLVQGKWRSQRVTLPSHEKLPAHVLEVHFTET
jgi:hypothetical protein